MQEDLLIPMNIFCKLESISMTEKGNLLVIEISISKKRKDLLNPICNLIRSIKTSDVRLTVNEYDLILYGLLDDCNIDAEGYLLIRITINKKKSRLVKPIFYKLRQFVKSNICLTIITLR